MEFRLLTADEVEARISTVTKNGVSILLYKDARVDQNVLDETFGWNGWKRSHQLIGDRLYCTVEVWDGEKNQWISKQDVGTESYTEKEKGQASDSFKRACFNFGIGRELYTAPFIWFPAERLKKHEEYSKGKWTCKDHFDVEEITYAGRKIKSVTVKNTSSNKVLTFRTDAQSEPHKNQEPKQTAPTQAQVETLKRVIDKKGLNLAGIMLKANVMTLDNLSVEDYNRIARIVKEVDKDGNEGKVQGNQ